MHHCLVKLREGPGDYEKCLICMHCISAPSPPPWPWATHELSRADQNPWPTVPLWEETDVGNVSLSFSLTQTRNKRANWHIIQWSRTETAHRAEIQPTTVWIHIASSKAIDRPLLFLSVTRKIPAIDVESRRSQWPILNVFECVGDWKGHYWCWGGLWHYKFITESLRY